MAKFPRSRNPEFVGVADPGRDVRERWDSHERCDHVIDGGCRDYSIVFW